MRRMRFFGACLFLLAIFAAGVQTFAQTTGTLRGTVADPSGLPVPGAKVTATFQATQVQRSATSRADGTFEFPVLPVGQYTLTAEIQGFKKFEQRDIEVDLGRVVVVNPRLELGMVTQVVTSTAEAPLVETSSTQLGVVEGAQRVVQLPLNERNTYQLLQLQPGVSSQVGSDLFFGSDRAGVVSVNGGRGRSNNFMVNGGDANDQFVNLPAVQPAPDTIQEFRVLTNTFDAEFGRNSGSIVNVVTKSGTNQLHGDVYEFFRNRVLNARGFFDADRPDFKMNQFGFTLGGPIRKDRHFFFGSYEGRRIRQGISSQVVTVPTAAERSGDFSAGSTFAGILTDQNVADILNNRPGCTDAVTNLGGDPIAAGNPYGPVFDPNTGNITDPGIFPTNIIPPACFDPTAKALLDQFVPLPNRGDNKFQSIPASRTRFDQFTVRTDHRINDKNQLSVYYYFTDDTIFQPFSNFQAAGSNVPGFGASFKDRFQQTSATHTWTINPTTVNEFRASYFREGQGTLNHPERTSLIQDSCGPAIPSAQCFSDPANPRLGITPGLGAGREGVPFISLSGGFVIGNNFEGELPQIGNTYQWADNFTKVMGKHTLKFGADVRRQQFNQNLFFDVNGEFDYFGGGPNDVGFDDLIPNYLLGLPDDFTQGAAQLEAVRSTSYYIYGQDSWKIKPNLTLNYGLRWELNTPIHDKFNRIQTFRPGQASTVFPCQLGASVPVAIMNPLIQEFGTTDCGPGSAGESVFPLGLVIPGDQGIPPGLTQTYKRSFAPRIGLAWSPDWSEGWLAKLTGGPGKTSIRAGFGIFYNPVEQLILEQFSAEPPFGGSTFIASNLFNTPFVGQDGTVFPNPFSGILNPRPGQPVDFSLFRPILLFGQFQPDQRSQYAEQYNLTIQREIAKDLVLQVAYVGTQGHRLFITHDLNAGNAQTCLDLQTISDALSTSADPNLQALSPGLACGPFFADSSFFIPANSLVAPDGTPLTLHLPYGSVPAVTGPNNPAITLVGLRPFSSPLCEPTTGKGCAPDGIPPLSSIFTLDTIGNSNYNSLQLLVEKRFSRGLQFSAAYTWSKSFDLGSSFEDVLNPLDFRRSYALSQFNAKHRFVFSYYWELPVPQFHGVTGKLANGWAVSGITTFQSGFPIRITSSDDIELQNSIDFLLPGEPDLVQRFRTMNPRNPENRSFDGAIFAPPALGTIGSSPRTVCCGPPIQNFDMAILKDTAITERLKMQFRAEFFNIFNRAQFLNPDGNISDGDEFGVVKRARDPRLIQFALKLNF